MLQTYLIISLGAIFGACARFTVNHMVSQRGWHEAFPYHTLFVNISGSLLMGLVLGYVHARDSDTRWALLLAVGFCGSYTTFSNFAYETVEYLRQGRWLEAGGNIALNNVLSMAAIVVGAMAAMRTAKG